VRDRVIEILRDIYDPEIPINIYDLGLVRHIDIDDEARIVRIRMIFTAGRMCPMPDFLTVQVRHRIEKELGYRVEVSVDTETRWSPSMATREGLAMLKEIYGEDSLRNYTQRRIKVRVNQEFNPMQYMREAVEARYRLFKDWLERTRL